MRRFMSHKTVHAERIRYIPKPQLGDTLVPLEMDDGKVYVVPVAFLDRHEPKPGGYLVKYEDGYLSFSPASAFENGYVEMGE